jgi:flagellar basal-body rod protein FlgB
MATGSREPWCLLDPQASELEYYMDLLSARRKLVGSNIADADTPGNKTQDIDLARAELLIENLANPETTRPPKAESSIKDADVAATASTLSKEQILQQSSVATLVQAKAIRQAVLSLLKSS